MKRVTGFLAITFLLEVVIHGPGGAVAAAQELKREALIEGAKKEGKVQIYGLLAVPEHMQIIQRFKEKYPFIEPTSRTRRVPMRTWWMSSASAVFSTTNFSSAG